MNRRSFVAGGLLALAGARGGWADLKEFAGKKDAQFSWSKQSEAMFGDVKVVTLKVRSQVWRDIPWDHAVQIFIPAKITHPESALLLITGGNPGLNETVLGAAVAPRLEAPTVILYNIPNQPLMGGKVEDDLIAHTFQEFLASRDETWPLLFPMVKSAVAAMDAVQEFSKTGLAAPIKDFITTGASKRGWTTYLTTATDKRVRAMAPMVFDNLNFNKQMPRQLELWGKYSEQIEDYSRRGLQQKMATAEGKRLVELVDPWFYRKQLTQPKLLIHGANDRYWATDATELYWDDLPDPKYLLAIPNNGHGVDDRERLLNTMVAFFHASAANKPLPKTELKASKEGGKLEIVISTGEEPKQVRLWTARADNMDFRPVKWTSETALRSSKRGQVGEITVPSSGGVAYFGEAEYELDGRRFTLSTPPKVAGKRPSA